jgi:hypothetical protein
VAGEPWRILLLPPARADLPDGPHRRARRARTGAVHA